MTKSSIEITENQYLIKLHKDDFEYDSVRKLLHRLVLGRFAAEGEDVIDEEFTKRSALELGDRFDYLSDK